MIFLKRKYIVAYCIININQVIIIVMNDMQIPVVNKRYES